MDPRETATQKHVLLMGGDGGWRNLGDQAMLAAVATRYQNCRHPVRLTLLCHRPAEIPLLEGVALSTALAEWYPASARLVRLACRWPALRTARIRRHAHHLARAVVTNRPGELASLLRSADAIHFYGGGVLNHLWAELTCRPFCGLMLAAARTGTPVYVTGQGLGPLPAAADRELVGEALRGARLVAIREAGNANPLLQSLFEPDRPPLQDGDDAVTLPPCSAERAGVLLAAEKSRAGGRPLVMVHYRHAQYVGSATTTMPLLCELLDQVIEQFNAHVVFVPMQCSAAANDLQGVDHAHRQLRHRSHASILTTPLTASETLGVLGEGAAAIGFSYHFVLFALMQGLPTVGLYHSEYYRYKMLGLFRHFDADECAVPIAEALRSLELLRAGLSDREATARRHRRAAAAMAGRVEATFRRIESDLLSTTVPVREETRLP